MSKHQREQVRAKYFQAQRQAHLQSIIDSYGPPSSRPRTPGWPFEFVLREPSTERYLRTVDRDVVVTTDMTADAAKFDSAVAARAFAAARGLDHMKTSGSFRGKAPSRVMRTVCNGSFRTV